MTTQVGHLSAPTTTDKWEDHFIPEPGPESKVPLTKPILPNLHDLMALLTDIWNSGQLTNDGPMQRRLEAALETRLGWNNVVATANGTLALQLACRSLNLDGEAIVPAFTFPATVQALLWNGLTPVFVDVEPDSLTIDPAAVAAAVSPRTSAIVAVHTFGNPADVVALGELANNLGLALIYDAAPAVAVRLNGRPITAFGDVSAVSFHATKVMHTVEGGAVVTSNPAIAESVRRLRNFGLCHDTGASPHGTNAKLNELEAAVGLLVLEQLGPEIRGRAKAMTAYRSLLDHIPGVQLLDAGGDEPNYAYAVARLRSDGWPMADRVHECLRAAGISSRRYFDHHYSVGCEARRLDTPEADAAAEDVLCLPLWGQISYDVVHRVSSIVDRAMT